MIENKLFNQEAEEALIGSIFLNEGLLKECTILPEQLYMKRLQFILKAMKRLDEQGKPIDVISVVEEIGLHNLENIGGISYLTDIACSVPTAENFSYYQNVVKEYDQKRKALMVASRIQNDAYDRDISNVLKESIHDLMNLEDDQDDDGIGEISSSLVDLYEDSGKDHGEITGIPSGFWSLDRLTGGFQKSDLIVVGARPSVGKTAFALNIALDAAKHDIVIIFSLEMSKMQLLKRASSVMGNINSIKMRNPRRNFLDEDWKKFSHAMGMLSKARLHIFDKSGMDMFYIWAKMRKLRREYGNEKSMLVVIDYLQLITGDQKHRGNRQMEISEISRMLKTMARELNIVVIALSQLSRDVESRQDKRPMLSDLRESGQIEQDADVIAFLYRDDYYHKETKEQNIVEIILAKQRNGPIGTIKLSYEKEYGKFLDLVL
ncbi:replicative DNA helicase [Lederbergia citrea]|uniref:replicative DNA helicase n=1 Tax=Lederbergia citrea TaxID=2833581 RepID=UPI001BC9ED36|nr:replicative DNA helicase [Lederbergia citrea]MBS4178130.1 replicative DNA helicase [Lederbergia citrea]